MWHRLLKNLVQQSENKTLILNKKIYSMTTGSCSSCTVLRSSSGQRSISTNGTNHDHWVYSPLPDIQPVFGRTMSEVLMSRMQEWDGSKAINCSVTGRGYTYAELCAHSRSFGGALLQRKIQRGDIMALALPNIPEYVIALLGSWQAGCIVTPTNPAYTVHEMGTQLRSCGAKIVLTTEDYLDTVLKIKVDCPDLKHVIVIGSSNPLEPCWSFFEMLKKTEDEDAYAKDFLQGSQKDTKIEAALLPFSSGTTGPPKEVIVTDSSLATNLIQLTQPDVLVYHDPLSSGGQERITGILPFFHMAGLMLLCLGMYQGAHVATLPKFEPMKFANLIKNHQPTNMAIVPSLLAFMCQSPHIERKDLESLESLIVGAAPAGTTLLRKILEKAGKHIFLQEAYGMTELSGLSHVNLRSSNNKKLGSAGPPIPSTICRVVCDETGQNLEAHQAGEILIKGPQVMRGYYKNEEGTKAILDEEGWIRTGDIGYYDDQRHFYIVDRIKELIKVKGFQVSPSELEDVLRKLPDVVDVAVIAVPDVKAGQLPRAYIVRKGETLTADHVHKYLSDKLSPYKQLKGGIEFIDAIPRTMSGKILRRSLLTT